MSESPVVTEPKTVIPVDENRIQIIQITDLHVYGPGQLPAMGMDTVGRLEAVVEKINREESPDMVLVTGDIVHEPEESAYLVVSEILQRINWPVFCLPGNHDLVDMMTNALNIEHMGTHKVIKCGNWSILMLNSVIEFSEKGLLNEDEMSFLREQLGNSSDRDVILCLHHHPLKTGSPWMDAMMLANAAEFRRIAGDNPRVRAVLWGHIHQEFTSKVGNIRYLGCPSTCVQFKPRTLVFDVDTLPPGYRSLTLLKGGKIETECRWLN